MNFFEEKWNKITKPELLCQPNIPKPLHGLNPRTIKGEEWWDKKRQEVYASTDYHCIACGVRKEEAERYPWLEAHEFWDIDYNSGKCEILSIEPLCHYCHNFIHSGRLGMILNREKTIEEVIEILEHGFSILKKNNLKSFPFTKKLAESLGADTFAVDSYIVEENSSLKWQDYYLMFEGKKYKSKFKDRAAWEEYYLTNLD